MKGDILVIEEHHKKVAKIIVSHIKEKIKEKSSRFTISVAGESGSGKSETAQAISNELKKYEIKSVILGQDDYFVLPPKSNDKRRREDPSWLGPHLEVKLDVLEDNLKKAISGKEQLIKPLIDYDKDSIGSESLELKDTKVVIAEGTYTSLLKSVDTKVFIARNRIQTLEHRQKRNRGNEVGDPFIENILKTEHKIIAGHKQLADFVITNNYDVVVK